MKWTKKLTPPTINPFIPPTPVGPTVPVPDQYRDVFKLFFTDELMELIRDESNRYASQVMGSNFASWTPITTEELEAFFGFQLLMGLNPKPSVQDYWSTDPIFHYPPISDRISRDRYRDISRYFHLVDNNNLDPPGTPGYDRLGKVRPLLKTLTERFESLYNPGREVAVDEAMIKFQGRSSLKQYIKNNSVKRGIKVWVLADSSNGYFSRLEVYTGKKGNRAEKGLGARVVKDLTSDFQRRWHWVFFDNFNSKALVCDLEAVVIYSCRTVQANWKNFPTKLLKKKLDNR